MAATNFWLDQVTLSISLWSQLGMTHRAFPTWAPWGTHGANWESDGRKWTFTCKNKWKFTFTDRKFTFLWQSWVLVGFHSPKKLNIWNLTGWWTWKLCWSSGRSSHFYGWTSEHLFETTCQGGPFFKGFFLVEHNWILNWGNWESIGEQDGETMGSTPS